MIFYIADTHFGHANIIKMCGRPFADVDEMNRTMIGLWNQHVSGADTVYIVGDLMFRCSAPEAILRQLKGKKRLILGNHDGTWASMVDMSKYFASVDTMLEMSDGKHGITLCHYPLLTWKHSARSYMIHGHIHNDTRADYWPLICIRENLLNAGVDINHFQPVTFDELVENNRLWKNAHES